MGKKKHNKKAKGGHVDANWLEAAGLPPGMAQLLANVGGPRKAKPMLGGMLGSRKTEQFVLGALAGAAAVYVMGDEELRGKLVKAGMRFYSNISGSFEEMKEQMADIKAEMAAEEHGAA